MARSIWTRLVCLIIGFSVEATAEVSVSPSLTQEAQEKLEQAQDHWEDIKEEADQQLGDVDETLDERAERKVDQAQDYWEGVKEEADQAVTEVGEVGQNQVDQAYEYWDQVKEEAEQREL